MKCIGRVDDLYFRSRLDPCAPQDQYRFVYETLMEYTRGIDSRFPVSFLADKIKERGIKDKKTKKNAYQMEYMVSLKILPLKKNQNLLLLLLLLF